MYKCIYIYIYIYIHTHIHTHIHIGILISHHVIDSTFRGELFMCIKLLLAQDEAMYKMHACTNTIYWVYIYIYMHTHTQTHVYMYMYAYIYMMYIYICTYSMHACIYAWTKYARSCANMCTLPLRKRCDCGHPCVSWLWVRAPINV